MSLEESINRLADAIEKLASPLVAVRADGSTEVVSDPAKPLRRTPTAKPAAASRVEPPKYNDVREAILLVAERKGMPAAEGILKSFGVTHAKSLKVEQYSEALAATQKALAA
jgi:hypothetical protein